MQGGIKFVMEPDLSNGAPIRIDFNKVWKSFSVQVDGADCC